MATRPLPPPDVQYIDPATGRPTQIFFDYLRDRDQLKMADLRNVSSIVPSNGYVLVYSSSSSTWIPGSN